MVMAAGSMEITLGTMRKMLVGLGRAVSEGVSELDVDGVIQKVRRSVRRT